MNRDLTTSRIDRQNILNNELAVEEIEDKAGVVGIEWDGKLYSRAESFAKMIPRPRV